MLLKHKRVPLSKVSVLWGKTISTKNRDNSPPIRSIKYFDNRSFLKDRTEHLRKALVFWDKKSSTESGDRRSAPPIVEKLEFSISELFWNIRRLIQRFFSVKWDKKFIWWRIVIGGPLSNPEHLLITDFLWTTDIFRYEKFWYSETKQIWETWGRFPFPSYPWKCSIEETVWNTEWGLCEKFRYCETKKNSTESGGWRSSPVFTGKWKISTSKLFWTFRRFLQRSFLIKWDEEFHERRTENRDRCLLFLSQTFFETRIFVKHRRVPLWNVYVLWDKTVSTKNRDNSPPIWSIKYFDNRSFLKDRTEHLRKTLVFWDKKSSTNSGDRRSAPLIKKKSKFSISGLFWKNRRLLQMFFSVKWGENCIWWRIVIGGPLSNPDHLLITEVLWITDIFLYETFWYCETKHIWQKLGYAPLALLSSNVFDSGNSLKHRSVPLQSVWVLGDKTVSTENRDTSLLYI